ncbi:hypothetical protein [Halalkalibaculum sp. DA384]|uniref:hypothetical protein n=1 Tax=Halalkalibaculum sp. DA384 TaxID=3373606 RepID=UPI0037541EF9
MDRKESIKTMLLGTFSVPFLNQKNLLLRNSLAGRDEGSWIKAFNIESLTPKKKIGGLIRFNDPSFFEAVNGRLVTQHGKFKRHRTFLFPQWEMSSYPYRVRVTLRKQDHKPVSAGLIFGAKTPYEFELGGPDAHGALFAYLSENDFALRDHRTDRAKVWKDRRTELASPWKQGETVTMTLNLSEGGARGMVSARLEGDLQAELPQTPIDLGKPDEVTGNPHIRGYGYWGFSVDGPGEVEILDIELDPGNNKPISEGLQGYERACEWCVVKSNQQQYMTLTFALREAKQTSVSIQKGNQWRESNPIPGTSEEKNGGMTVYTHKVTWEGDRPSRYRLLQDGESIFEGRIPPFNNNWEDKREVVGIGMSCNEVWRYKQQNQLNWFDHILTEQRWQGHGEQIAFDRHSDNIGDTGAEYIKYQGTGNSWPDFIFAGDDYPGYPDNPILTLSEVDYQQRIWDVFAACDAQRELHGNVPSAFKGGDHEFANATPLQPGGAQGQYYPNYIKNAYQAISLDGHEPVSDDEVSFISRPIPGWIEVFHIVTRYNQTVNIGTRKYPNHIDETNEQSPSGTEVMHQLERWARTSPAPFKIVHGDHPLGDIRTASPKETYRLYPWERRRLARLIVETGLMYAIGDEHNLRLVKYTDFSETYPNDPILKPLTDVSVYEFGLSNLSGEWFRHIRESGVSEEGIKYDVLHQTPDKTQAITHGFQKWNGYTVFRFNKNQRSVKFEIWKRHNKAPDYPAKDPRREDPDYSLTFSPNEIMWDSSMLPEIDLTRKGLKMEEAENVPFTVYKNNGQMLYTNRADKKGRILQMPAPSLEVGTETSIKIPSGTRITVKTI